MKKARASKGTGGILIGTSARQAESLASTSSETSKFE